MAEIKEKKPLLLTAPQIAELLKLKRELYKVNNFDPFALLDTQNHSITDFAFFTQIVKNKAKAYNQLSFRVSQIERSTYSCQTASLKVYRQSSEAFNLIMERTLSNLTRKLEQHADMFERLRFKLSDVFGLVEDYLDHLELEDLQDKLEGILKQNMANLKELVHSKEPNCSKIHSVFQEFENIEKNLKKSLEARAGSLTNSLQSAYEGLVKKSIRQRSKSIMVEASPQFGSDPAKSRFHSSLSLTRKASFMSEAAPSSIFGSASKIDLGNIKFEIDNFQTASSLMAESSQNYTFIEYKDTTLASESYLSTLKDYGLTLVQKGQTLYSRTLPTGMQGVTEVVHTANAYYLLDAANGRILAKKLDSTNPLIWWNREKISYMDYQGRQLRTDGLGRALAVNFSNHELLVIEIEKTDFLAGLGGKGAFGGLDEGFGAAGRPGRELSIINEAGARVDAHEMLPDNRMVTVTENGVLTLLEVDLDHFEGYQELGKARIELKTPRTENCFSLSVCERSQLLAVLIRNYGLNIKASRIVIYNLVDKTGQKPGFTFRAELDLWEEALTSYYSICFMKYIGGDKIALCGHSYKPHSLHLYTYDLSGNQLRRRELRSLTGHRHCYKLSRCGGQVFGIFTGGQILKVSLFVKVD